MSQFDAVKTCFLIDTVECQEFRFAGLDITNQLY